MMIRDLRVLALGLLPLAACGTTKEIGQLDESSSNGDDSASDPTLTESDTQHMCGFESSSGGSNCTPETGDDEGPITTPCHDETNCTDPDDGGTDAGGCSDASICDPQPDGTTHADFVIDGDPFPFVEVSDLELPCTIASIDDGTVTLSCTVKDAIVEHTIEADLPETFTLAIGTNVVFSHYVWVPMWTEEWFSLRADFEDVDPLLLAGIRGGTLLPYPIETGLVELAEPFYGHVGLSVQDGVCEVEPLCEEEQCARERRQAITATTDAEAVVYDGTTGHVGQTSTMEVRVQQAGVNEDIQCTDFPSTEYLVLVVNVGDG